MGCGCRLRSTARSRSAPIERIASGRDGLPAIRDEFPAGLTKRGDNCRVTVKCAEPVSECFHSVVLPIPVRHERHVVLTAVDMTRELAREKLVAATKDPSNELIWSVEADSLHTDGSGYKKNAACGV